LVLIGLLLVLIIKFLIVEIAPEDGKFTRPLILELIFIVKYCPSNVIPFPKNIGNGVEVKYKLVERRIFDVILLVIDVVAKLFHWLDVAITMTDI
jgi:hypothetical protein